VREETCCELALASWPDQAVLCPSFEAIIYQAVAYPSPEPIVSKTYKQSCSNCQHEILVLVLEESDEVKP